jgi:hypothetical protein
MQDIFWGDEKYITADRYKIIKVISHVRLYEPVMGKCRELKHRCYCLAFYEHKDAEPIYYNFGYSVAEQLIERYNLATLPLFDPLKSWSSSVLTRESSQHVTSSQARKNAEHFLKRITPVNKQLHDLINLTLFYWGVNEPYGLFANVLGYLASVPHRDCDHGFIQSVLKAVQSPTVPKPVKSPQDLIAKLEALHGTNLKHFEFDLLQAS